MYNSQAQVQDALLQSEAWLAAILRSVPVAFYTARVSGDLAATWVSDTIEQLSGFRADQFVSRPELWVSRLHPEDRPRVLTDFQRLLESKALATEYRWQCADGTYRWFLDQAVVQRDPQGRPTQILGIWQDITERQQAHLLLEEVVKQLHAVLHRMEVIREDERTRIAREMHDELGGKLTCLKIELARLSAHAAAAVPPRARPPVQERIASTVTLVDETIEAVRRLASELRPSLLDDFGLVAALEEHAKDLEARTGIQCRVLTDLMDINADREATTALFRICQEALTNAVRHAKASRVVIEIAQSSQALALSIRDNGRGIPAEKLSDPHSLGIVGMRERARLVGGTFDIIGTPGHGTILSVLIPLSSHPRAPSPPGGDGDAGWTWLKRRCRSRR